MSNQSSDLEIRTRRIKEFFDEDSARYINDRYPAEPRTCDQFSYIVRKQYVLEMLDRVGAGGQLLDVGCGPGVLTPDLVRRGWRVSAVDLSTGMLAAARRATDGLPEGSVRFAAAQATRLPFRDAAFDVVLCIGVVSYVDDVPALLEGIRRVLRPGGQAIFQISNALGMFEVEGRVLEMLRRIAPSPARDSHDRFRSQVQLHPYRPGAFDRWCRHAGLERRQFRFFDFRPPQVINRLAPGLSLKAGRRLEALGTSLVATGLAASYLVRVARPSGGRG
jgi:SAM-dependent methyltransferase